MDMITLTTFFMWCTIINGGILIVWTIFLVLAPDFIYRVQSRWFPLSRDQYNVIIYALLGLFKIIFIVFCVAPYVALLIMA